MKFKAIAYSLILFLTFGTLFANSHNVIEWTVPPEGGYGKYVWKQDGETYSINGEYSHKKQYWWDATYKFGGIVFKGEIKSTGIWLPNKGHYIFPDYKNEKFYVDNSNESNCQDLSCQYFTKVIWANKTIDLSTKGLSKALAKFDDSKIKIQNEIKRKKEEKLLAEEKRKEEERKRLEEEKRKKENEELIKDYEFNKLVLAGSGSGFYINSRGTVVTNYHVIEGCEEIKSGKDTLKLISYDIKNDLVLLNSNNSNTPYLKIRKENLNQGEDIYVIGYPFGKDISSSAKITRGIITALHGMSNDYSKIQIDAPIQTGNSGGPVLDRKGQLIGIAVAKANTEYFIEKYGVIPDDINFAIKTNILKTMMEANNISQENNTKLMEASSGADVFKIANPSTLYLTCYMKYGELLKILNEE